MIRYECPNGTPLTVEDGKILVRFGLDGTFCTSDRFLSTVGQTSAQSTTGQPIPIIASPKDAVGAYALYGGNTRRIGGNTLRNPSEKDIIISIYWVGDMKYAAAKSGSGRYPDDEDAFLESRIGVQKTP